MTTLTEGERAVGMVMAITGGLIRPVVNEMLADPGAPAPRLSPDTAYVYFIEAQPSGRIKIGTSRSPRSRLRELQTGSPERLRIAGQVPGGRRLERQLHARYADARCHGEWFLPSAGLLAYIRRFGS